MVETDTLNLSAGQVTNEIYDAFSISKTIFTRFSSNDQEETANREYFKRAANKKLSRDFLLQII